MTSTFPHAKWRLISQPIPAPAAINLAIDEAILRAVASGDAPPTLRLYHFATPALILGRGQPFSDVDHLAVEQDGITVVRRMSGGTAVLTGHDFSYAVMAPTDEPRVRGSIKESYRALSEALVGALQLVGIAGASTSPGEQSVNHDKRSPVCFEIPSMYEIMADERKVVGNSQMRIRNGILQHGIIPLDGDTGNITRYLSAHPDPERILGRTTTVAEMVGYAITWPEVAQAVLRACETYLNLDLELSTGLTGSERQSVSQLLVERYGNPTWTQRL